MEIATTALKAFDLLTILAGQPVGMSVAELARVMNEPRTNVWRLLRTAELYGFVIPDARGWRTTPNFHRWVRTTDRHETARRRYRAVLKEAARHSGELVLLGLHEGNGVVHVDYIESDHRIRVAPAPATRHALHRNALGKLALSRRPDLASRIRDPKLQRELAEIRRTEVAWNREETVRGMIAMACAGYTNSPSEPMIAVAWPASRFSERKAESVLRVIRQTLFANSRGKPDMENRE